jgi:hypothetical protein
VSTRVCIVCDKCGARTAETKNGGMKINLIRNTLAQQGWKTNDRAGKDLCPKCAKLAKPK